MDIDDLRFVADMVRDRSGIVLGDDKAYLLESRLLPVARTFSQPDIHALVQLLRRTRDEKLIVAVVEAMTTNESSFFRDNKPFDIFRQTVLPKLLERPSMGPIRIWSAACSTGQEPYTLSICLREDAPRLAGRPYEIVATDIALKVIEKAQIGVYSQFEVQRGMPTPMLIRHFTQVASGWEVKPEVKACVSFRQQNLLEDYGRLGRFDVVFCRNVLIYFDEATKLKVLKAIHGVLNPGGVVFLGSAETLLTSATFFKPLQVGAPGVYVAA